MTPRLVMAYDVDNGEYQQAVTSVEVGSRFIVTQKFEPLSDSLYKINVQIDNISDLSAYLDYRRVMDWDVPPSEFYEFVSNQKALGNCFSGNDGFASADPLAEHWSGAFAEEDQHEGTFDFVGPMDQGALFQFEIGYLAAHASTTFTLYYGATDSTDSARSTISGVAQAYSIAAPTLDWESNEMMEDQNAFMFGYNRAGGGTASYNVIDVDVDSDNDNGFGRPECNDEEDRIERDFPGKGIPANAFDSDEDGIPGYLDGYNANESVGPEDDDDNCPDCSKFVPVVFQYMNTINLNDYADATLTLQYDAVAPGAGLPVEGHGTIRLWTGPTARTATSVTDRDPRIPSPRTMYHPARTLEPISKH